MKLRMPDARVEDLKILKSCIAKVGCDCDKQKQLLRQQGFWISQKTQIPLPLCTVDKMQGTTVCTAVVNLGLKLFALGQAYVALSRVRSLNELRLNKLDCGKLTNKHIANTH
jgi:hypothetical protein